MRTQQLYLGEAPLATVFGIIIGEFMFKLQTSVNLTVGLEPDPRRTLCDWFIRPAVVGLGRSINLQYGYTGDNTSRSGHRSVRDWRGTAQAVHAGALAQRDNPIATCHDLWLVRQCR